MSLLIDDIQEELRREDLMQRFKNGLPWIIGAVVVILLSAAGYTVVKGMREKTMIRYEALYDQALENIRKKEPMQAKNLLERVAAECSGLKFLALMTLADMTQKTLVESSVPSGTAGAHQQPSHQPSHQPSQAHHAKDSAASSPTDGPVTEHIQGTAEKTQDNMADNASDGPESPKGLAPHTRKTLAHYDAQLLGHYQDPQFSQFLGLCRLLLDAHCGGPSFGPSPLTTHPTVDGQHPTTMPLRPLSEQEHRNAYAMYQNSPTWKPLAMALELLKMPKGPAQQQALNRWIDVYQGALGSNGTLPLYTLMGTVEAFNP